MLVSKTKRQDGKGYRKRYDAPKAPVDRLLESGKFDKATAGKLRRKRESINGVHLVELIQKRLRHLLALRRKLVGGSPAAGDLALRAAPPGPSPAAGEPRPPDVPRASAG